MSPKYSSLAYDEIKEQNDMSQHDISFEPVLNLIVNTRTKSIAQSTSQILKVEGSVTVSF